MDSAINARLTSPQCLPPPPIHLRLTGVDGSSEAHLWLNSTYKGYFHLLMQLPFSGLKLPCQFLLFAGQLLCMQLLKFSNLFFWGLLKRNQKVSAKKKKKPRKSHETSQLSRPFLKQITTVTCSEETENTLQSESRKEESPVKTGGWSSTSIICSECPASQGRARQGRKAGDILHSEQTLHCGQVAPSFWGRCYLLKSYWLCSFLERKTQLYKTIKFP